MSSYLLIIIARENPTLVGILYKEKNINKNINFASVYYL